MENTLQFFNLVGLREQKGGDEAVIMLEPTRGNFRVSPEYAKQLGITDGSFVTVQVAEVNGVKTVFIGKGKDGVVEKDEEGNDKVDGRGRKIYAEDGFGASVREIRPGSNIFRFSVTAGWDALNGDTEKRKYFTLGEGIEVTLPTGDGVHSTTLYPLTFEREEDKLVRSTSEVANDEESVANTEVLGDTVQGQSFQEEEL